MWMAPSPSARWIAAGAPSGSGSRCATGPDTPDPGTGWDEPARAGRPGSADRRHRPGRARPRRASPRAASAHRGSPRRSSPAPAGCSSRTRPAAAPPTPPTGRRTDRTGARRDRRTSGRRPDPAATSHLGSARVPRPPRHPVRRYRSAGAVDTPGRASVVGGRPTSRPARSPTAACFRRRSSSPRCSRRPAVASAT